MVLCRLPYRFVVPLPVRESEMLGLTNEEWDNFERSGAEIHDLPLERSEDVQTLKEHHGRLSVNDCLYLVIVQRYDNGILLTRRQAVAQSREGSWRSRSRRTLDRRRIEVRKCLRRHTVAQCTGDMEV